MALMLALDLSQNLGWACGDPADPARITYGSVRLPSGGVRGHGPFAGAMMDAIGDLLRLNTVEWMLMEAPLTVQAQTHNNTARQQLGAAMLVELIGYRWDIPVREATPDAARLSVFGKSRFTGGRQAAKDAVMAWCRQQGYRPPNDDAGDAIVLLYHGWSSILGQHVRQKQLFPGRPAVG